MRRATIYATIRAMTIHDGIKIQPRMTEDDVYILVGILQDKVIQQHLAIDEREFAVTFAKRISDLMAVAKYRQTL